MNEIGGIQLMEKKEKEKNREIKDRFAEKNTTFEHQKCVLLTFKNQYLPTKVVKF